LSFTIILFDKTSKNPSFNYTCWFKNYNNGGETPVLPIGK